MKLENVVGVVGGIAALGGCLIPIASRGAISLRIGETGGLSLLLYACAIVGLLASLVALIGRMRNEEWVQIGSGVLGLIATFLVHRAMGAEGVDFALGLHLLYWGFAMLLAEGLIHFGDRRVGLPSAS